MATTLQTTESGHSVRAIHERLNSGPSDGVEVVTLTNKSVSVRICPTRGMGILDATFDGVRVGWDSPVNGPVHPALVNLESRNKLGWLDGFTELFVRCGLAFMGPPGPDEHAGPIVGDITLHGRIANTPAQSVEIECHDDVAIVRGVVEETVLFGPKAAANNRNPPHRRGTDKNPRRSHQLGQTRSRVPVALPHQRRPADPCRR